MKTTVALIAVLWGTASAAVAEEILPDVVGQRLSGAVRTLEEAGFVVQHDGGEKFGEYTRPGKPLYPCGDDMVAPVMEGFREVSEMIPVAGTALENGGSVALTSTSRETRKPLPQNCGQPF